MYISILKLVESKVFVYFRLRVRVLRVSSTNTKKLYSFTDYTFCDRYNIKDFLYEVSDAHVNAFLLTFKLKACF